MISPGGTETPLEFKLAGVPAGENLWIFAVLLIICVQAGLFALWAFGEVSFQGALLGGLLGIGIVVAWALGMVSAGRGSVKMSSSEMRIHSMAGIKVIDWQSVLNLRVEGPARRWLDSGRRAGPPYLIVVNLSRALRLGLHPWRWETRGLGIPVPIKTIQFQVEDAEGLISTARSLMERREGR